MHELSSAGRNCATTSSEGSCLLWIDEAKVSIKPIYECRCNGRLQTKRSTRLSHTGRCSFWRCKVSNQAVQRVPPAVLRLENTTFASDQDANTTRGLKGTFPASDQDANTTPSRIPTVWIMLSYVEVNNLTVSLWIGVTLTDRFPKKHRQSLWHSHRWACSKILSYFVDTKQFIEKLYPRVRRPVLLQSLWSRS